MVVRARLATAAALRRLAALCAVAVGVPVGATAQVPLHNAWSLDATSEGFYFALLDPAHGEAEPHQLALYDVSRPQLTADPTSSLVYVLSGPGQTPAQLLTVDPDQYEVLESVTLQPRVGLTGLAFDPIGRGLYSIVLRSDGEAGELATVDPHTGDISYLGELTFIPALPGARAQALAFAPTGVLYAIDNEPQQPRVRLWRVDPSNLRAIFVGRTGGRAVTAGDMAFLGEELWLMQAPAGVATHIDPGTGAVLAQAVFPNTNLFGLAQRNCALPVTGELTASDAPADGGGRIVLDWSGYDPPPDVGHYEIVRAAQPCALVGPQPPIVGTVAAGEPRQFVDDSPGLQSFTAYYFVVNVMGVGAQPLLLERLFAGPTLALPNLLINEFTTVADLRKGAAAAGEGSGSGVARKIGEQVEIRNQSEVPLDLTGFRLSNGAGPPAPDEEPLFGVVQPHDLLVHTLAVIELPDAGGTLALLPPEGWQTPLDVVAYGSQGGAPTVPAGFTVSRVEGTGADAPDDASFEAAAPTFGFTNVVTTPQLGSSILFNEVVYSSATGGDYIELYNPQGGMIALEDFAVSDGVSFLETVQSALQLAPGQMTVLNQGQPGAFTHDLQSNLLYLYKITDSGQYQRIDQLGWSGGPSVAAPPGDALLRVPDGLAVYLGNQGANWSECGGGTVLLYGVRSPGQPNIDPRVQQLVVDPAGGTGTYPTIAAAMAVAVAGSRVLVRPGTYNEPVTLKNGVEVRGASDDPRNVLLVGSTAGPAVRAVGVNSTAVLASVTIRGGEFAVGAGLLVDNANPRIRSVRFEQNHASQRGGAAAVLGGNPVFDGCLFLENSSAGDGGAIAVLGGGPRVTRSLFVRNSANQRGAAIFAAGGATTVENCVFDRNSSLGNTGGAVHTAGGFVDVQRSIVSNGLDGAPLRAEGGGGSGGISFRCGALFDHPEWFDVSDGGIDTAAVFLQDPMFCQPLALNYAIDTLSPLAATPTACSGLIGLAGPPCADVTATPPLATGARARLLPAVPNPFNPATELRFELPAGGRAALALFDARGRRVRTLLDESLLPAGSFAIPWDGRDERGGSVASGVYFARLRVDGQAAGESQRLALVR
jgi:predicted outer membrane repeat protein